MCGITGFWSDKKNINYNAMEILKVMADTLRSRGPDGEGYWTNQDGLFLAHRRLAIIDLSSSGQQPMQSFNSQFQLIFNGEIYNYLQLKKELSSTLVNNQWRGSTDTEVILAAFECWGVEDTIQKLNGMFACAVWDNNKKSLYLIRDRAGEKPLYYGWQNGHFIFASELQAIKKHPTSQLKINKDALSLYMQYGYIPTPYSIYEQYYKLPPGSFIEISLEQLKQGIIPPAKQYWSLQNTIHDSMKNPFEGSYQNAVLKLENILQEVVQGQMISDVPIGAFLSGGIDSSTIVALMQSQSEQPVKTFSIGYEDKQYNEAHHAAAIASYLKTDHTEWYISDSDALDVIPKLQDIYSEPFADSSQIPTILVSQLARKTVTVALSGDAGDELFGGYNRYIFSSQFMRKINYIPFPLRKFLSLMILNLPIQYLKMLGKCIPGRHRPRQLPEKIYKVAHSMKFNDFKELYKTFVCAPLMESIIQRDLNSVPVSWPEVNNLQNPIDWMMAQDFNTYLLDDILVKLDRASMSTSLETRVPFLDHSVISFAWGLPQHMKIQNGTSKRVLRDVLFRHVPNTLIERPKMGFGVPIDEWLRGALFEWADNLLQPDKLNKHGLFNTDLVHQLWTQHLGRNYNRQHQLWNILMFQTWYETNHESS